MITLYNNLTAYYSEVLVNMTDFKAAFSTVGPSMQRGFQVQVDKMNWNDVGGLEDVKKVKLLLNLPHFVY